MCIGTLSASPFPKIPCLLFFLGSSCLFFLKEEKKEEQKQALKKYNNDGAVKKVPIRNSKTLGKSPGSLCYMFEGEDPSSIAKKVGTIVNTLMWCSKKLHHKGDFKG